MNNIKLVFFKKIEVNMQQYIPSGEENENVNVLVADIVAAYVSNNNIDPSEVSGLIEDVFSAFTKSENNRPNKLFLDNQRPAVDPDQSVFEDYIICLEDGRKFKSLKRHLMSHYGLTPEQYREKWNLDFNYPMVAPNYALERSGLAKKMGLGRKKKIEF